MYTGLTVQSNLRTATTLGTPKMAVVQKVVIGQRLAGNFVLVLVGWWFRLVVVDRWSLFRGGR